MAKFRDEFSEETSTVIVSYDSDATYHKWKITVLTNGKQVDELRAKEAPEWMTVQTFFGYLKLQDFSGKVTRWINLTKQVL